MSQETNYLAKVCANIIKAQNLSFEDKLLTASHIIALLTNVASDTGTTGKVAGEGDTPPPAPPTPVKEKKPLGPKLMDPGVELCCSECSQPVFKVIKPVYENMVFEDFVDCYNPLGHTDKTVLSKPGGGAVNCPLCGAEFSVPLINTPM